jgi:flagellar biosynthesis protein FlhG
MQIATCADDFLGAVLRDWVQIDPACNATDTPTAPLRRLVREQLRDAHGDAAAALPMTHTSIDRRAIAAARH